jgi:hypothetical protein
MPRKRNSDSPPIVAGFIEGLFAPVFELIFAVFATALNSVSTVTGAPNMGLFFAVFGILDLTRSVLACLAHTQFAIGNVIGNFFGIWLFYGAIKDVSQEAANSSFLLTVILAISLIIGFAITIWRNTTSTEYD